MRENQNDTNLQIFPVDMVVSQSISLISSWFFLRLHGSGDFLPALSEHSHCLPGVLLFRVLFFCFQLVETKTQNTGSRGEKKTPGKDGPVYPTAGGFLLPQRGLQGHGAAGSARGVSHAAGGRRGGPDGAAGVRGPRHGPPAGRVKPGGGGRGTNGGPRKRFLLGPTLGPVFVGANAGNMGQFSV